MKKNNLKIVITGGPGGGKTTALDLFSREFNSQSKVVPEAATLLFKNGINREVSTERIKIVQQAIFNLQITMENIFETLNQNVLLVCDRGTLDGLAYWPGAEEDFFKSINSTFDDELSRYDGVIFFETAAKKTHHFSSNNPYRIEGIERAIELDDKLKKVWSSHPQFTLISSTESFVDKITHGVNAIKKVIENVQT